MTVPGVVRAARDAARAGDTAALHALVDWPLSGVGPMLDALRAVDPEDRWLVVDRALADFGAADPEAHSATLRRLRSGLAGASVTAADAATRRAWQDRHAALDVPPELPPAQRAALAALVARVAGVAADLYVAGPVVFGVTPDGRALVVSP